MLVLNVAKYMNVCVGTYICNLIFAEAKLSSPSNETVIRNMPVTINCTVTINAHSNHHKLVWIENNAFIKSGDNYSIWSLPSKSNPNIQYYYLVIHKAVNPVAYTCMLITTSGHVTDSATQHVFVEEGM